MLKIITSPTVEPVTVAEAKAQAVVGINEDDTLVGQMISAARGNAELLTRRSIAPQVLEVVLDEFPDWEIELPRGPVTEITSVKYYDEDGVEQTLSTSLYEKDMDSLVARVQPIDGEEWPETKVMLNAVRVRYNAGWTAANIPPAIKMWIMIRVASMYAQRENHIAGPGMMTVMPMHRGFADGLLDEFTVLEVG